MSSAIGRGSLLRVSAFLLLASLVATTLPTAPAAAFDCPLRYDNEQAMANETKTHCREFVVDPGVGKFLSHEDLWRNRVMFQGHFDNSFLWYAPKRQQEFTNLTQRWSYCETAPGPGNRCAPGDVRLPGDPVIWLFDRTPEIITIFGSNTSTFIAAVCGNYNPGTDTYNPTITGKKFNDVNQNGQRDGGEPYLSGWTIELHRVRSYVGQSTGWVSSTTTSGTGAYVFDMKRYGPGVYEIREVQRDGWTQTTQNPRVTVNFGVANKTYTAKPLGNAEATADLEKVSFTAAASADAVDIGEQFTITVTSEVKNNGPALGVTGDDFVDVVEAPADCDLELVGDRPRTIFFPGEDTVSFDSVFNVVCSERSDHFFQFENTLVLTSPGFDDPYPFNNSMLSDRVHVEVFEMVELDVGILDAKCRTGTGGLTICEATVPYANDGPADDVRLTVSATLLGHDECTGDRVRTFDDRLGVGESAEAEFTWILECPDDAPRAFDLTARIVNHPDDPHAPDDDFEGTRVGAIDIKPNSDPNSITTGRNGVVAAAVLGSATFDPVASIDPDTVTFGPTGYEAEAVRCNNGEDVNGDGYLDLVCHFYNQDTGFTPDDEYGYLRATLVDGSAFVGADAVRVLDRGSETGNDWHGRASDKADENTPPDNSDRGNGNRTGQGS